MTVRIEPELSVLQLINIQAYMKFAIIKERKNPPDRRVVLSPQACEKIIKTFPEAEIIVESSDVRVFTDSEYSKLGFNVTT